jgi:hypothetical protein
MKRRLKLYSLLFFIGLLVGACNETSQNSDQDSLDAVLFSKGKNTEFRGHTIGDKPEEVLERETADVRVKSDSLLRFSQELNLPEGKTDLRLIYVFDSFGLFEIQADIYPPSMKKGKEIEEKLSAILSDKYGELSHIAMVKRWTTNSPANNIVEISLSLEKDPEGAPFVSLNYLEPLENEL